LTAPALLLRNAALPGMEERFDVLVAGGRVRTVAPAGAVAPGERHVDLAGRLLLPGLVNAHDHLDASTLPPLADRVYPGGVAWSAALAARQDEPAVLSAMAVPLADRLFLGGLRNLLAGATAVLHHGAFHRSLARPEFPIRVLERYQFAPSASTEGLRRTYRTTDRRIPWVVHAAEGTDDQARGELDRLQRENVLRQNTVIIHGIALPAERRPAVAAARACVVWSPEAGRRLYAATADVAGLRAAGVRVGLGAESPACGVRDALSNLAAAHREALFSDDDLLALATTASAEVARLPAGGVTPGAVADLIAVDSTRRFLEGHRPAVALALVAGQPRYGEEALMKALVPRSMSWSVDGAARALAPELAARAASLWRRHRGACSPEWMAGVRPGEDGA
jgi:cytosine/adenosine deaminase-related metal-dependent hydrolase